jgi:hypothetical protein
MLWQYDSSHIGHSDQILFTPSDLVNNWDSLSKEQRNEIILDFADPRKVESSKYLQHKAGKDAPQPLFSSEFTNMLFMVDQKAEADAPHEMIMTMETNNKDYS